MLFLARPHGEHLAQIHEIAEHCSLPEPFLGQILRLLVRAGLVQSKKGVGGGFVLARKPEEVSFLEVLEALEGPVAVNRCQSPVEHCQKEGNCSMEFVWAMAQDALLIARRPPWPGLLQRTFPYSSAASVLSHKDKVTAGAGVKTS
jgi:Rrf2 family protein